MGFALKRPSKRLVKADEAKRECFVGEYAALTQEARLTGDKIFFADEAHFRADAELRSKWVLKGEPAPPFSRRQALPGYSPDFNADEAIWGWAREEATGNLCLGTKALVRERVNNFLGELTIRRDEIKRRCRTVLQSRSDGLLRIPSPIPHDP